MNAKKIMGAVLVALLAAALFVGAGAAAEVEDMGSIPAYTALASAVSGVAGVEFTAEDGTIIATSSDGTSIYFAASPEQLGKKYTGNGISFTLVAPTAGIDALLPTGVSVIGNTISETAAKDVLFNVTGPFYGQGTDAPNASVVFIKDGVYYNGVISGSSFKMPIATSGKWGVAANLTGAKNLTTTAFTIGQIYYFTIASLEDGSITATQETVNIDNNIVINVNYPGQTQATIKFDKNYANITGDLVKQAGIIGTVNYNDGEVIVKLGADGSASIAFKALKEGKATFTLLDTEDKKPKVDVEIIKGTLTVVADKESYYLGNEIELSGTSTAGKDLFFYIEGTNFPFVQIDNAISEDLEFDGEAWTATLDSNKIKSDKKTLVSGGYTIIVSTTNASADVLAGEYKKDEIKKNVMKGTYGTETITMVMPFITDVKAAAVAIQGSKYEITGTAIAADEVRLYIFGTSYFAVDVDDNLNDEIFMFTIEGEDTGKMAPGTYFYIIQHPMNDKFFNVWNGNLTGSNTDDESDLFYAATNVSVGDNFKGNAGDNVSANFIFNAWTLGTNYAAQALLETIAAQEIDDRFVQGTFEIAAQKLSIDEIPAEVAKGTKLTINGYSNSGKGVEVIVNVLAGKFGATIKGDENLATFITEKAVTNEDGTFEAVIDTSKLELGSYIVTVEIDGTMYDSDDVKIVEAAAPEQPEQPENPEQPEQPEQPTEPETPGFGALAALAGLGAVAVLLLRRE